MLCLIQSKAVVLFHCQASHALPPMHSVPAHWTGDMLVPFIGKVVLLTEVLHVPGVTTNLL